MTEARELDFLGKKKLTKDEKKRKVKKKDFSLFFFLSCFLVDVSCLSWGHGRIDCPQASSPSRNIEVYVDSRNLSKSKKRGEKKKKKNGCERTSQEQSEERAELHSFLLYEFLSYNFSSSLSFSTHV